MGPGPGPGPGPMGPWALGLGPWPLVVYYYIITPLFYIIIFIQTAVRVFRHRAFLVWGRPFYGRPFLKYKL